MKIEKENYTLYSGDCRDVLITLAENSVDSVICDPPYELTNSKRTVPPPHNPDSPYSRHRLGVNGDSKATRGFMGKEWDGTGVAFDINTWKACYRVLKPGGYLLAFGGTRTFFRMFCAIEDAGFEIRDAIMWLYLSGFPKSLDISKSIDKSLGKKPTVIGKRTDGRYKYEFSENAKAALGKRVKDETSGFEGEVGLITEPATEAAKQWEGWGSALKPAVEPICVARKPLEKGLSLTQNVLKWGTGAINIDESRIGTNGWTKKDGEHSGSEGGHLGQLSSRKPGVVRASDKGRWPANLIHSGEQEIIDLFPESKNSGGSSSIGAFRSGKIYGKGENTRIKLNADLSDDISAARFFYSAKASRLDREEGLEDFEDIFFAQSNGAKAAMDRGEDYRAADNGMNSVKKVKNDHPTVKPVSLMRYLCKLVTPPDGTILDNFCGSFSTGKAAMLEGFNFIGIELDEHYIKIGQARMEWARNQAQEIAETEAKENKRQLELGF